MPHYYGTSGAVYRTGDRPTARGGRGKFRRDLDNRTVGIKTWDDPNEAAEGKDRVDCLSRWVKVEGTMLPIEAVSAVPGGPVVGFALPVAEGADLSGIVNPPARAAAGRYLSHRDLIGIAANTAALFARNHAASLFHGDVNLGNFIIGPNRINGRYPSFGIDMDFCSFRGRTSDGRTISFRCPVGQPEFTAPEASGKNLRTVDRGEESDCFSLAVLIWMLVKDGSHPFAWRSLNGANVPQIDEIIRMGGWPLAPATPLPTNVKPLDVGARFRDFPLPIQKLFVRAFRDGHKDPKARPAASEWALALTDWEQNTPQTTVYAKTFLRTLGALISGAVRVNALQNALGRLRSRTRLKLSILPPGFVPAGRRGLKWLLILSAITASVIVGTHLAGSGFQRSDSHAPAMPLPDQSPPMLPDDLFNGVPLYDELHRESNTKRRSEK